MAMLGKDWIMAGIDYDNPKCIHSPDELLSVINDIGFLPLFKTEVPGFSVEELTYSDHWWSKNKDIDPWIWREKLVRDNSVVYGRFFNNKAGFISRKWFPHFVNYRRNGYDFDALCEDKCIKYQLKDIINTLHPYMGEYRQLFTYEIKSLTGYTTKTAPLFEKNITTLQMGTYVCIRDFVPKKNKKGDFYGKGITLYAIPEDIYDKSLITSMYQYDPIESQQRIIQKILSYYENATYDSVLKLIDAGKDSITWR